MLDEGHDDFGEANFLSRPGGFLLGDDALDLRHGANREGVARGDGPAAGGLIGLRLFQNVCDAAPVVDFGDSVTRHRFCRNLLDGDAAIDAAQNDVGHSFQGRAAVVGAISEEDDDIIFDIGAGDRVSESVPLVLVDEFDVVLVGPGFDLGLIGSGDDDDAFGDGLRLFDDPAEHGLSAQGEQLLWKSSGEGLHSNAFPGGGDYCRHRQIVWSERGRSGALCVALRGFEWPCVAYGWRCN